MRKRKPIPVGTRFARLQTIAPATLNAKRHPECLCLCDCGSLLTVSEYYLRHGVTRSCGCLRRDVSRAKALMMTRTRIMVGGGRHFLHGYGLSNRTYRIWVNMRSRCRNAKLFCWKYYGGAGVTIAARWDDFRNFLADMGECPPGLTIDRWPNPKGNYEPGNCRWATRKEQMRNFSRNRIETVFGVTACIAELCERFNVESRLVRRRLGRGWTVERAFTEPNPART